MRGLSTCGIPPLWPTSRAVLPRRHRAPHPHQRHKLHAPFVPEARLRPTPIEPFPSLTELRERPSRQHVANWPCLTVFSFGKGSIVMVISCRLEWIVAGASLPSRFVILSVPTRTQAQLQPVAVRAISFLVSSSNTSCMMWMEKSTIKPHATLIAMLPTRTMQAVTAPFPLTRARFARTDLPLIPRKTKQIVARESKRPSFRFLPTLTTVPSYRNSTAFDVAVAVARRRCCRQIISAPFVVMGK